MSIWKSFKLSKLDLVSAGTLHIHTQGSDYLSAFQAHGLNYHLLHDTALGPLGHRVSDKSKDSGDIYDQFHNIASADKKLLSPRVAGAVSQG